MILQDMLLISTGVNYEQISEVIQRLFVLAVPLLIVVAGIYELLTSNNWDKLIIRVFFAILLSTQITGFVKTTVPYSLELGSRIIDLNQTEHILLTAIKNQKIKDSMKGADTSVLSLMTSGMDQYQNDIVVNILIAMSYLLVSLIGVFYSFVYSLLLVLGPTLCLISIFPLTNKALSYAWTSAIWLILTPVVLGSVLAICEVSGMESLLKNSEVNTLANYCYLLCYSCLIFFCPAIASGIISTNGINTFSDKMQTIAGGGIFLAAIGRGISSTANPAIDGVMNGIKGDKSVSSALMLGGKGLLSTPLGKGIATSGAIGLTASRLGYETIRRGAGAVKMISSGIQSSGVSDSKLNSGEHWVGNFNSSHANNNPVVEKNGNGTSFTNSVHSGSRLMQSSISSMGEKKHVPQSGIQEMGSFGKLTSERNRSQEGNRFASNQVESIQNYSRNNTEPVFGRKSSMSDKKSLGPTNYRSFGKKASSNFKVG